MSAKMAADGIRTHVRIQPETYSGMEIAGILKRRTALITQPSLSGDVTRSFRLRDIKIFVQYM